MNQVAQPQVVAFQSRKSPHPTSGEWSVDQIAQLFALPFNDLMYRAQTVHREHFDPHKIQRSTLLSIKTGGCPEDCGYCPQAARYDTDVSSEALMPLEDVLAAAQAAKAAGASRFCMGAAWRGPKQRDLDQVKAMIVGVKSLGLQTCATLGMLKPGMADELKDAGLDYYNHNIDTAPDKYSDIISTRQFDDRLDTLRQVREAGMHICSGGIVGMGETREQRAAFLAELANLDPQPESVPINQLVKVEGTPLANAEGLDWTEFVRTIAVARITMPKSYVRLSAGRQDMTEAVQAMCFLAGANSIFYGEKLLTTENPAAMRDKALFEKLNLSSV